MCRPGAVLEVSYINLCIGLCFKLGVFFFYKELAVSVIFTRAWEMPLYCGYISTDENTEDQSGEVTYLLMHSW